MLKFSRANAKLRHLKKVDGLSSYLKKRQIYSIDLLAGWSCPQAKDCLAKVHDDNGKRKLKDGKDIEYRCYAASLEAFFPATYNAHKYNFDLLLPLKKNEMVDLIQKSIPKNAGVIRIHTSGDFFRKDYFLAWLQVAKNNPDKLFYAYTKCLKFWVDNLENIPDNMILTASKGGKQDSLIDQFGLRKSIVVFSEDTDLPIDHDDSHAADPTKRGIDFALLVHGIQPAGSDAAVALRQLNGKGSYRR